MPASPRIDVVAARSPLVRRAFQTAAAAHRGQVRNGSGGMPYIEHPTAVAELLAERGFGEEALAAALLHDVVEDSELTVEDVRREFGDRVAGTVDALTDDESIEPYRQRKAEHRERVAPAGPEALAIYAADKLTNVRTLRGALATQGEAAVAAEFKAPLDVKVEIWEADLEMLRRRAPELPFLEPLAAQLTALRDERRAPAPRP